MPQLTIQYTLFIRYVCKTYALGMYGLDPLSNQEMQCNNKSYTIPEIGTYISTYLCKSLVYLMELKNIFYAIWNFPESPAPILH